MSTRTFVVLKKHNHTPFCPLNEVWGLVQAYWNRLARFVLLALAFGEEGEKDYYLK